MKKKPGTKFLLLSMSLLIAASLSACGNTEPSDSGAGSSTSVEASSAEEYQTNGDMKQSSKESSAGESTAMKTAETAATDSTAAENNASKSAEAAGVAATDNTGSETAAADRTETAATPSAISEEPLSAGLISIDGDIICLGTRYSEIHGGNWSLRTEDYEKYQSYSLNPRTTSGSAMGLYSDKYGYEYENFHIMVSVMNASEDPIPYLDGTIDYLSIPSITRLEVLPEITLPGGLTLNSTEDDFRAVYGEPSSEYNDESTEFRSLTFKDGDVDLKISWYKGRINEITLTI